jgi:hypothetical protein
MDRFILALVALSLGGCTAYQVRYETPSTIALWHDPVRSSQAVVQAAAQTHCGKVGKNAVPVSSTGGAWEGIVTTFECRPRE